jgi:hypothetical protein
MNRLMPLVTCALILGFVTLDSAQAQFRELVKPVPSTANALMMFDAAKVFESPAAVSGGWKDEYHKAFAAGLVSLPPGTNRYVAASQIDFEFMEPMWDVAVLEVDHQPSLPSIARELGGSLDSVSDMPAVVLPSDTYIVQLAEQIVAAMSPANRQVVGRWLRELPNQNASNLSPYLQEAIGFVDNVGTPIIMALDLQDVLVPQGIRERMQAMESLKDQDFDPEALTSLLASARGVTLGITIREKPYGSIKVDFGEDASMLQDFAKPLLLEILANRGAMIEDIENWGSKVEGNTVTLGGYLTESGLRRVMSLLESPINFAHASAGEEQDPAEADQAKMAQASKAYFDSIMSLFDDLQGRKGTATHLNIYGVWFDKYAKKVDQLPLLNVDPDLLNYGQFVAEQLRNASMAIKGIGMRSRVRQVNEVANMEAPTHSWGASWGGSRYGRYGWYGGGGAAGGYYQGYLGNPIQGSLRQQQTIRTQVRAQEKGRGAANVQGIIQNIKNVTGEVRRQMTQKYQIEF